MTMDDFLHIMETHKADIEAATEYARRRRKGLPRDRWAHSDQMAKQVAMGIEAQADLIRVLTWQLQQAVTAQREQQRLAMSMGEPRE
jgi:hypothetical protein